MITTLIVVGGWIVIAFVVHKTLKKVTNANRKYDLGMPRMSRRQRRLDRKARALQAVNRFRGVQELSELGANQGNESAGRKT